MPAPCFAPVLVQSSDSRAVASDTANQAWLSLCCAVGGPLFDVLARLYPLQQTLETKLMIETALDHVGAAYVYQRASDGD